MSNSLRPNGMQHARFPCPSLFPRDFSNLHPLSWWCHLTILASVNHFSSCPQSFPASGSFPMSQLFTSGRQNIEDLAIASVIPVNIQGWFPLELTGLISLQSEGLWRVFSNITIWKHQFFCDQPSLWSNSHMTIGKTTVLTIWTFVIKVMSLFSNILSRFLIAFLPRNKRLLMSWLQSPFAVILEPKQIKSVTASTLSSSICHEVTGPDAMILIF